MPPTVTFPSTADIDLRKILKLLRKMNYNESEYFASIGEGCNMFWYYFSEGSGLFGPLTIDELKGLHEKGVVTKTTLIWHPILDNWQYYICTKELVKGKKELPLQVSLFIEDLKKSNTLMPVYLKQGYIHMRGKGKGSYSENAEMVVWLVMTESLLLVRDLPEERPILELDFIKLAIIPEASVATGDLSFTIGENKTKGQNFFSSFQKEVLEWLTELRKMKYYHEQKEESITEMPLCVPGQSNLIVRPLPDG